MLQNRVDPFGSIIKTEARGAWMGNRGILHNKKKEIVRPYKLKAWITCKLDFKGRSRQVMAPNRYTELFFMDEATAFAAGHRPCFECRRDDFNRFKNFWLKGNPEYGFTLETPIQMIDEILHGERMGADKSKKTFEATIDNVANGCFVLVDGDPYLAMDKTIFLWSPFGYGKGKIFPSLDKLSVLTPKSIVNTLRAGYLFQTALHNK